MKKKPKASIQIYKRLLAYVKPHRGLFAISIIGFLMYSGTQTLFAALIKHIIDTLQTEAREGMYYLPLLFSGLIVVHGIGAYLGNYFLAKVSTNVVHALRCELFNQYTRLPTAYFDANNSGYMISRITNNVGEVTKATTDALRTFVREGFTAIGLLAYLFYSNWMLSLVFVAIAPIIVILVVYVSKRLRMISKKIQTSIGDMTHITSELVGGHRVVRSYGGEDYERRRFLESSLFNRRQALKAATTLAVHNPILQLIIAIALSFLMYMALFFMKQASVGEFVGYLTAAFLLPRPIRQLSDANSDIQKGIAAAESLFEILDEEGELDEGTYQARDLPPTLFDDHEHVGNTWDKQRNDHHRDRHVGRGKASASRHVEQPRRAEVAAQKADEDRFAHPIRDTSFTAEAEQVMDDRLACPVHPGEKRELVEQKEQHRAGQEEGDRFLEVPLDAGQRLGDEVREDRAPDGCHLHYEVAPLAGQHLRSDRAHDEDGAEHSGQPHERRLARGAVHHREDDRELRRTWYSERQQ